MTGEVKGEFSIFRVDVDAVRVEQVVEELCAHFKVNVRLPVLDVAVWVVGVPVLFSNGEDSFPAEVVVLVSVDVPGDGGGGSAELSEASQLHFLVGARPCSPLLLVLVPVVPDLNVPVDLLLPPLLLHHQHRLVVRVDQLLCIVGLSGSTRMSFNNGDEPSAGVLRSRVADSDSTCSVRGLITTIRLFPVCNGPRKKVHLHSYPGVRLARFALSSTSLHSGHVACDGVFLVLVSIISSIFIHRMKVLKGT